MSNDHPNLARALATLPDHWSRDHWRKLYAMYPHWLDLETSCPHCGAAAFQGCETPTGYHARTHKSRQKGTRND